MKKFSLFGKIILSIGIIFFVLGLGLFIASFVNESVKTYKSMSLAVSALGVSMGLTSFLQKED